MMESSRYGTSVAVPILYQHCTDTRGVPIHRIGSKSKPSVPRPPSMALSLCTQLIIVSVILFQDSYTLPHPGRALPRWHPLTRLATCTDSSVVMWVPPDRCHLQPKYLSNEVFAL